MAPARIRKFGGVRAGLLRVVLAAGVAISSLAVRAWAGEEPVGAAANGDQPGAVMAGDPLAQELDRRLREDVSPLLNTYCVKCHGAERSKGGIRFDRLGGVGAARAMLDDLAKAKEMVGTREMPPRDEAAPSDHERLIIAQWLEAMVQYVPVDAPQDPGWFTIHRLNRNEYRNTIRDLFGLDPVRVDVAAKLPSDDMGYGFDNIADVLSVSPLAVEAYLDAAEQAIEAALGPRVTFGDVERELRLASSANGSALEGGGQLLYSNGGAEGKFDAPLAGEYIVRVEAWETHGGDENARLSVRVDGKERGTFSISGTQGEAQRVEVRLRLEAGRRRIGAFFTNDYYVPNVADRNLGVERVSVAGPLEEATTKRPPAYRQIFGNGRGFLDDDERARLIIAKFAGRAYRREVSPDELAALLRVYGSRREDGEDFEGGVRTALAAVLVSPNFLYRSVNNPDSGDPGVVYRLDGYELASRLSYFLWSSMPDEALLARATDGSLRREDVLVGQVRRMLQDPKSDAFIENFTGQWLQLRALDTLAIDTSKFREYDAALRRAMQTEARMFFGEVLREDRSVLEFLDSRHTFLNGPLARHYGVERAGEPADDAFVRVELGTGSARGGVLTMGAVLTLTSNTTRTSPVKRGLYVLEQVLGTPPPPPPPDIPRLEQAPVKGEVATLREQLAAHVANPTCAVCHNRLDPLGLALENFDAVGRWRESEGGREIDARGVLPGGVSFNGARELKGVLLARADQFVETLSGKVLTYAIGRGMESFDRPAIRAIATRTREHGDRFGAMIEAVVLSETFRTCRGREVADE